METCQLTPAENLIIVLQVLALKISIRILLCYTGVSGSNFSGVSGVLLNLHYLEIRISFENLMTVKAVFTTFHPFSLKK